MNDVMRTLRRARPAELDPDAPVDERLRHAELARAMAAGPAPDRLVAATRTTRKRFRPIWGVGLAGAVAAGTLAALILVPGGEDETGPPKNEGPGRTQPVDARTVLLAAADKAGGKPSGRRAYWYQSSIESHTSMVGEPGSSYAVISRTKYETWTPTDPKGKVLNRRQDLGTKPATPKDAAAWRRAGSPTTFTAYLVAPPGSKARKKFEGTTAPGPVEMESSRLHEGAVAWFGRNMTMKELQALPSDPKRLKARLMRYYEGHDTEGDRPMNADRWLYEVAGGLLTGFPVKPEVRAGAYRMLASLPLVRSLGQVKDPEGRPGHAIAIDHKEEKGVVRDQLIIDLGTGDALATTLTLLKPAAGVDFPAGGTLGSGVTLAAEWTDSVPR
ncbi:hypothetical protein D0T12_28460 [Actinomadura spongiicola]|uniref:CU044_5270 family protein n=1 Tax=Actinomadura spongiicola TaxID=2303421 RepID=A0A372G9X6_9ACTN|nr:CU044_5270 family protein [Actinomadura spongiicola]RFS82175.1 hypothetical protein D0T12_28460 [Actinomadura spongiicola]